MISLKLKKCLVYISAVLVLSFIMCLGNTYSIASANTIKVSVTNNMKNNQVWIYGNLGWFKKECSFTIKNVGRNRCSVWQGMVTMGTKWLNPLGDIYPGQSKTISFKAKGKLNQGYAFMRTGGPTTIEVIANGNLSVRR